MTEDARRKAANAILIAAAVASGYYILLRTPRLRGLAWRLAVIATTVSAPAWLNREVSQAWNASGKSEV